MMIVDRDFANDNERLYASYAVQVDTDALVHVTARDRLLSAQTKRGEQ
ncbi:hypothetical protein [Sinorhizobium chiapasense]|uniref:Uncharacterized protein n=1 Tax=Sinorhizobium chiapasense TaxID=501572 RepID=A0ABZ2BCK7_9HYPH